MTNARIFSLLDTMEQANNMVTKAYEAKVSMDNVEDMGANARNTFVVAGRSLNSDSNNQGFSA